MHTLSFLLYAQVYNVRPGPPPPPNIGRYVGFFHLVLRMLKLSWGVPGSMLSEMTWDNWAGVDKVEIVVVVVIFFSV